MPNSTLSVFSFFREDDERNVRRYSADEGRDGESDDEYYRRKRKVKCFVTEKESWNREYDKRASDDERDKENFRNQQAIDKREYGDRKENIERGDHKSNRKIKEEDDEDNWEQERRRKDRWSDREEGQIQDDSEDSNDGMRRMEKSQQRDWDKSRDRYRGRDRYRERERDSDRKWDEDRTKDKGRRESPREDQRSRDRSSDRFEREKRHERERRHRDKERYRELRAEREKRKYGDEGAEGQSLNQPDEEQSAKEMKKETTEKKKDVMDILTRTGEICLNVIY